VKTIGHLRGIRCPHCGASGVVLGPVAGNDFDAWMLMQPCCHGLGRPLREEIDRPMLLEIHQDGAIDPALAERKIIDAEHTGCGLGRRRGAAENPQNGIPTQRHPQAGSHPCAGFAARLTPEAADRLRQPLGALCMARSELRQAFRKGPTWTRRGRTAETSDLQTEAHGVLRDGKVTQATRIAAVHACR
jgi:hypothetical protein